MLSAGSKARLLSVPPGADEREILMKRKQAVDVRDSEVRATIGNEVEKSERSGERKYVKSSAGITKYDRSLHTEPGNIWRKLLICRMALNTRYLNDTHELERDERG